MLDRIEEFEVQLVQEKRKVLDETDRANEQSRKYRKVQEENEAMRGAHRKF